MDHGVELTGMTIVFGRYDLEQSILLLQSLGFHGAEIWIDHLSPLVPSEAYGKSIRAFMGSRGMRVPAFNAIGDASFTPHEGRVALMSSAAHLAEQMRLASFLGAPTILIWDGVRNPRVSVTQHTRNLIEVIERAREYTGLSGPPVVSVEFHPFTYALAEGCEDEVADALTSIGAGVCLDFCHFGVARGKDWIQTTSSTVWRGVNHVHYADSDCQTSELHHPPGLGELDLASIAQRLAGSRLHVTWDLYGWPSPMTHYRGYLNQYRSFVCIVHEGVEE